MKRLTLHPLNEPVDVETRSCLLDALLAKELNVPMACGGNGLCATCHVFVKEGKEGLTARTERERRTLSFISGTNEDSRLACQCRVVGDGVKVEIPEGMYIEKAEDLLSLLGTRSPTDVLHPVTGKILIAKGKLITRSQIAALKEHNFEVDRLRDTNSVTLYGRDELATGNSSRPKQETSHQRFPSSTIDTARPQRQPTNGSFGLPEQGHVPSNFPSGSIHPRAQLPAEFQPGTMVGKCLIVEQIGKGGSGVVFRAIHRSLNIPVAVKLLNIHPDHDDPAVLGQLRNEAQLLAQLNHPNIVRVWDYEDAVEHPYMVLEYVEGWSLRELIEQSGRVCQDRAISIMIQVGEALREATRLGIVHRDVKPGNILLSKDGIAKIADLGLAMIHRDEPTSQHEAHDGALFRLEGTVAYMSPEQVRGETNLDHRADIYSLGATFYHAVTGKLPFRGKGRKEVLEQHLHAPVVPPHKLATDVLISTSEVICRMMAKEPDQRYQDYETLCQDFELLEEEAHEGDISSTDTNVDASRSFSRSSIRH